MKFDAYEYVGVIVPGSVVLVACSTLYPNALPMMTSTLSVGDLGLTLILAFVAGHLLQAGGNVWESIIWWFAGGMPTSWPAKTTTGLLSESQLLRLDERLRHDFGCGRDKVDSGRGLIREIVVRVRQDGDADRIDKFNRNYGLMRGIAVAFIVSAGLVLLQDRSLWPEAVGVVVIAGIATYRMIRFGIHYAREVYAEYLSLGGTGAVDDTELNDQGSST
ncbi:MAG: hypothetical protein IIA11_00680 [Proteobacteria bacterium]|nr:hypothetical protein [Pseudomonadota bacterium]